LTLKPVLQGLTLDVLLNSEKRAEAELKLQAAESVGDPRALAVLKEDAEKILGAMFPALDSRLLQEKDTSAQDCDKVLNQLLAMALPADQPEEANTYKMAKEILDIAVTTRNQLWEYRALGAETADRAKADPEGLKLMGLQSAKAQLDDGSIEVAGIAMPETAKISTQLGKHVEEDAPKLLQSKEDASEAILQEGPDPTRPEVTFEDIHAGQETKLVWSDVFSRMPDPNFDVVTSHGKETIVKVKPDCLEIMITKFERSLIGRNKIQAAFHLKKDVDAVDEWRAKMEAVLLRAKTTKLEGLLVVLLIMEKIPAKLKTAFAKCCKDAGKDVAANICQPLKEIQKKVNLLTLKKLTGRAAAPADSASAAKPQGA